MKKITQEATADELADALRGYLAMMKAPDNAEITMSTNEIRQTGLFASVAVSRILWEKVKSQ